MPTVLRFGRFRVVIYLPSREHGPPHVHVRDANGEVVIDLATAGKPQMVREVSGMRPGGVVAAFWLVERHSDFLLNRWREFHG